MNALHTLLLSGLALLLSSGLEAQDLFERVPRTYEAGVGPYAVFGGDFDGDGDLDLAVINQTVGDNNQSNTAVLMNQGDGTFADKVEFASGLGSSSLSGADFNGDGAVDLVCVAPNLSGNKNIFVTLNDGDGGFPTQHSYYTHGNPVFVTTADVDADGHPDLVIAATTHDSVAVLKNAGDGTFGAAGYVPLGTDARPQSVCPCDLDGDGDLDLAVANGGLETASLLFNTGGGVFGIRETHDVGTAQGSVTASDLDGDGDTDLALAHWLEGMTVLLNSGDGSFGEGQVYALGGMPRSIQAADFNGDGDTDLAVLPGSGLFVFPSIGDGTFAAPTRYDSGGKGGLLVDDLDGDGSVDLAMALLSRSPGGLVVMLNRGDGILAGLRLRAGIDYRRIWTDDLDGDGAPDDVALADTSNQRISLAIHQGGEPFAATSSVDTQGSPFGVWGGDLDNDGDVDLAATTSDPNAVNVLLNAGDGSYASPIVREVEGTPSNISGADFDGDGDTDFVIVTTSPSGISAILSEGPETYGQAYSICDIANIKTLWAGDLDGDGDTDLVYGKSYSDDVFILENHGDATFDDPVSCAAGASDPMCILGDDLDGDGDLDLAVSFDPNIEFLNGSVMVLANEGDGTFATPVIYEDVGGRWLVKADLNNDGYLDLAGMGLLRDPFAYTLAALLGNGDGTFAPPDHYLTYRGNVITAVDFDQDGDLEVAVGGNALLTIHDNLTLGRDIRRMICVLEGGVPSLQFTGLPERTYVIQRASVLEPGSWSSISEPLTPDTSGAILFDDPVSPLPTRAFYRVMEVE